MPRLQVEVRHSRRIAGFTYESLVDGLPEPQSIGWLPAAVDSLDVEKHVQQRAPADGREVVEWMHCAAASNAVLETFSLANGYNRGDVRYASGDGYIPGVRESRVLYARSEHGSNVRRRGYAIVVANGREVRVPYRGKATIIMRDFLAWAAVPWAGYIQYVVSLLRWARPPRAPVRRKISFVSIRGLVAPVFVYTATSVPSPIAVLTFMVTSSRSQKMLLRGRSASDYTRVLFEKKLDVDSGETEYQVVVTGIPAVPKMVLEMQPENGTKTTLDYLTVYP